MWWDSMTTRQPTVHYHRSQQQELAPVLVLVGGDGQGTRAIHGSSRSVTVHPPAFVPNGSRLVVVATLGWRNGPLLSMRSDDDDDDVVTISSWLNFGCPCPPGTGCTAGQKFLALPYYSQHAVFESPPSAFIVATAVIQPISDLWTNAVFECWSH